MSVWLSRLVVAAGLVFGAWSGSAPDELVQGRVAAIDHRRGSLQLDVYLAGTDVPRAASHAAALTFDGRTRFRPAPTRPEQVRPGDDLLVRVVDGRATEITLLDLD